MQVTLSPRTGFCILDSQTSGSPGIVSIADGRVIDTNRERPVLSLVEDWQTIQAPNRRAALEHAEYLHQVQKATSLGKLLLLVPANDDAMWIYEDIETLLGTGSVGDQLLNNLLIAPISGSGDLRTHLDYALSHGYGAFGNIFNRLLDLQPLLVRFSHIWLQLPDNLFLDVGRSRTAQWRHLVESGQLLRILEASKIKQINTIFGTLAFQANTAAQRTAVARLGRVIAKRLLGTEDDSTALTEEIYDDDKPDFGEIPQEGEMYDAHSQLQRALAEIDGILSAVANGDDYHAEKYLAELVERQAVADPEHEYAVKSLCNIAKQCADLFRTDFEHLCLEKAYDLDAHDPWMLIQYSDHLKRLGRFDEARKFAETAKIAENDVVAMSLLADISAQEGNFEAAIREYKAIPGWSHEPNIRTAIADNLRRLGRFDEALHEYSEAEKIVGSSIDRIKVGIAEIAKRQGSLERAKQLYEEVIDIPSLQDRSWWVYRVAYAGILKQLGDYERALTIVEDVIQKVPFSMQARVLRSSLWGLLDKGLEGLMELTPSLATYSFTAVGEWVSEYTRGLLLLRTSRYSDAQERLVANLENSIVDEEERTILRLAAALSFLARRDFDKAKQLIFASTNIERRNAYVEYVANVLKYHICILEGDKDKADALYRLMSAEKEGNIFLWEAVEHLRRGDEEEAARIEIDALLRIAA